MKTTTKTLATATLAFGLLAPMVSTAATADTGTPAPTLAAAATTSGVGGSYTDRTFINYTAAGKTGQYHVYASGIDRSKPVGVVFQFHGDGGYEFKNPSYKLPGLNAEAKKQNMIFVSMKAPNTQNVWWNGMEANGEYARSLIQTQIMNKYNIDKDRVWMVGYSGGAQFISQEMLEEHSDLMTGGGALMFGGGAAPYSFDRAPSAAVKKNLQLTWYTGLDDGMGNSDPGWSALDSARKGHAFYKNAGFTNTSLQTPAGIDHFEYNEPRVFGTELTRWAKSAPATSTAFPVKGAIGSKYASLGGAAKLGQPVNAERAVNGGMSQTFRTSAGKVTDIYWKSGYGAHAVSGGIKGMYDRLGSSAKLGFPLTDERAVAGGVMQTFKTSTGKITDIYWSSATGANAVTGSIRGKLNSMGGVSRAGFPTQNEVQVSSTKVTQKFQKGTMTWLSGGRGTTWTANR